MDKASRPAALSAFGQYWIAAVCSRMLHSNIVKAWWAAAAAAAAAVRETSPCPRIDAALNI